MLVQLSLGHKCHNSILFPNVCGGSKLKLVSRISPLVILMPKPATPIELRKLISIANYQFGPGVGDLLFNPKTKIASSKKTRRIRHIYHGRQLIATLRPTDGLLALTLQAASMLLAKLKYPPNLVTVQNDVSEYITKGGDIFAKHIVSAPERLHPAEEVIAIDEDGHLLGVGSALQSGNDMKYFKRGVAIKIRRGTNSRNKTISEAGELDL